MLVDERTVPDGVPTGVHLCPALLLQSEGGNFTPFNLVPTAHAGSAERLLVLGSIPFYMGRFFGSEHHESGMTYPLDIHFLVDQASIDRGPRIGGRPVVMWGSQPDLVPMVRKLLEKHPAFVLVIIDDAEPEAELAALAQAERAVGVVSVDSRTDQRFHPVTPIRIWCAYLNLLQALVDRLGWTEPMAHRMAPELTTLVTLSRQILAAQRGSISPWVELLPATTVPWDFVSAPNAILLNHITYKLCLWSEQVFDTDEAHAVSLRQAQQVLAARGLGNLFLCAARVGKEPRMRELFRQMLRELPRTFRPLVLAALEGGVGEDEKIRRYSEVFRMLPEQCARHAPHQVIVICPSATLAMERARVNFRRHGIVMETELSRQEPEYFARVLAAASLSGRKFNFPEPSNATQEEIAKSMHKAVSTESMFLSALGVLYATRFISPVLKLTRTGTEVFDPFLTVHDEFVALQTDHHRIRTSIAELAKHTAALFPEGYLDFLVSRPEPLVHSFGDYPLEFTAAGHDHLGYRAALSRTPITPGFIPTINYQVTELTIPLPNRLEECVLVTPFPPDDEVYIAVKEILASRGLQIETTNTSDKEALKTKLADERIKCLFYIGHAYHNAQLDINALQMANGYFGEADLRELRVPPLVVLVGCATAPSVSVFGGMHQAFLRSGASLVVGTSFPVPKFVGSHFLASFIDHLLGAQQPPARDVADIVYRVRHEIRPSATLYSLVELERISWDQMDEIFAEYKRILAAKPASASAARARESMQVLAKILARRGLIPSESAPLMSWEIISYPLFFSTFGFPWNSRRKQWQRMD